MSGPFDYKGGSVMAMMGENSVVMAADRRLG
jgi:hypothetical protein